MLLVLAVSLASVFVCRPAGPSFPINNGVLQSALNAAGKDITNAATLAATNVLVGGVPVMTTNSPVTTNNLPGLLPQLADGNAVGLTNVQTNALPGLLPQLSTGDATGLTNALTTAGVVTVPGVGDFPRVNAPGVMFTNLNSYITHGNQEGNTDYAFYGLGFYGDFILYPGHAQYLTPGLLWKRSGATNADEWNSVTMQKVFAARAELTNATLYDATETLALQATNGGITVTNIAAPGSMHALVFDESGMYSTFNGGAGTNWHDVAGQHVIDANLRLEGDALLKGETRLIGAKFTDASGNTTMARVDTNGVFTGSGSGLTNVNASSATNPVVYGAALFQPKTAQGMADAYCSRAGVTDPGLKQTVRNFFDTLQSSNLLDKVVNMSFYQAGMNWSGATQWQTLAGIPICVVNTSYAPPAQLPGGLSLRGQILQTILPPHGDAHCVMAWFTTTGESSAGSSIAIGRTNAWIGTNFVKMDYDGGGGFLNVYNTAQHIVSVRRPLVSSGVSMLSISGSGATNWSRIQNGSEYLNSTNQGFADPQAVRLRFGMSHQSDTVGLTNFLSGWIAFSTPLSVEQARAVDAAFPKTVVAVIGDSIMANVSVTPFLFTNSSLAGLAEVRNYAVGGTYMATGNSSAVWQLTNSAGALAWITNLTHPNTRKFILDASGHNDLGNIFTSNGAAFFESKQAVLTAAAPAVSQIVEVLPHYTPGVLTNTALADFEALVKTNSGARVITSLGKYLQSYFNQTNYTTNTTWFSDTVHPTAACMKIIGGFLAENIAGLCWDGSTSSGGIIGSNGVLSLSPSVSVSTITASNATVNSNLVLGSVGRAAPVTISASGASLSSGGTNLYFVVQDAGGNKGSNVVNGVWPNLQTGTTYTLDKFDSYVRCSNAAAVTVTVPAGVFVPGKQVTVVQSGAGQVTITNAVGLTLRYSESAKLRAQYSPVTITFVNSAEAEMAGDFEAAP